jgi:hypothetical protein
VRNPKVQRLYYEITGGQDLTYDHPPDLEFTNDIGHFRTEDGTLCVEPIPHFHRESEARAVVEAYLDLWTRWANLQAQMLGILSFKFLRSEIIDLDPPAPGESQTIYLETAGISFSSGEVTIHISRKSYPAAPELTCMGADVESAYQRWMGYKEGREPLQSMSYFVLTLVESVGSRQAAASYYKIEKAVLSEIGRLASTKGSSVDARKATTTGDLTGEERAWLERVIPKIIVRIAETRGEKSVSTMRLIDT